MYTLPFVGFIIAEFHATVNIKFDRKNTPPGDSGGVLSCSAPTGAGAGLASAPSGVFTITPQTQTGGFRSPLLHRKSKRAGAMAWRVLYQGSSNGAGITANYSLQNPPGTMVLYTIAGILSSIQNI